MILRILRRKAPTHRWQRGAAAVEFAIITPFLILALAPFILHARYMWHYTIAHKAAQDAARYMSTVSVSEMQSRSLATSAREVAVEIARRELLELVPGEDYPDAEVLCDTATCGLRSGAVPSTIRVFITFNMHDPIFNTYLGPWGKRFEITVEVPYVGR